MNARPYDFYVHEASTHVDASPDEVWAIAGDLAQSASWAGSGQVLAIRKTSEGPVGVGTVYEADEKIGAKFKSLSKIVEYDPPRKIVWLSAPSVAMKAPDERWHMWSMTVRPEGGGTLLTQEVRAARAPFLMRIVQVIGVATSGGTKAVAAGMDKTLRNIKDRAEKGATVGT